MDQTGYATLRHALGDPGWHWGIGVLGAIAEFSRDPWEGWRAIEGGLVTARGGIQLRPDPQARLVAHEAISRREGHWQQGLAWCLDARLASLGPVHEVVTELGPDEAALRPRDAGAVLFDMGLGFAHLRACVRSADPALIAALRAGCGRPLLEAGNPAAIAVVHHSPHRVFLSPAGRIEVYQPIPPPDGRSPEGPHTHLLPQLLRSRRTHAATIHLPEGMLPVLDAFPPHPLADAQGNPAPFDAGRHAAFQALLQRHGSPAVLAEKRAVLAALAARLPPHALDEAPTRETRAARRVTLRQIRHTLPGHALLAAWHDAWDRPGAPPVDEPSGEPGETMDAVPGHG